MRINRPTSQRTPPINLPVRVTGFFEERGQVGLVGQDLRSRAPKEVRVLLTETGAAAENTKRNSLKTLRDGFRVGRNSYKLQPGGVVSFRDARQNSDGTFRSDWANVVAYTQAEAERYAVRGLVTLRMGDANGRSFGNVFVYDQNPKQWIEGQTAEEIMGGVKAVAEERYRPSYVVRFLDKDSQVVDAAHLTRAWNKDESRVMSPNEFADYVADFVRKTQAAIGEPTKVSIVAATRYQVSPKALAGEEGKAGQANYFHGLAKGFLHTHEASDEPEEMAKAAFVQISDDGCFANRLYVDEPYGPGMDYALLGQLRYAPVLASDLREDAEQTTQSASAARSDDSPVVAKPASQAQTESPAAVNTAQAQPMAQGKPQESPLPSLEEMEFEEDSGLRL